MQRQGFSYALLRCAVAVPFCYFGIQLLAAPLYPNYDFIRLAASDLGSPASSLPLLFNLGAALSGFVTLLAAFGIWHGLEQTGTPKVLVWLTAAAVAVIGLGNFWAAMYPMPHPLHSANPSLLGFILMPFLMAGSLWHNAKARVSLLLPVVLMLAMILIRAFNLIEAPIEGVLQRLIALAAFAPIGIGGWVLLQQSSIGRLTA
jgi:hypothetical membrane protein